MAHDDPVGHASADDEYLATPPDSTYEHTDAHVGPIVKFMVWLAASAIVIHIGLGFMYEFLIQQSMIAEQPYPLATGQDDGQHVLEVSVGHFNILFLS